MYQKRVYKMYTLKNFLLNFGLLTQTKSLHDSTVTLNVLTLQVVQ